MFHIVSSSSKLKAIMLVTTLLACSSVVFAQRGGGRVGGGLAGGTGLSQGNHASGIDEKDDLKDFHEVLAVQATSQQIIDYVAMLKSTTAASEELQSLGGAAQ